MRIITWNCNQALGRKLASLIALNPDIAVVQECGRNLVPPAGYTFAWHGINPNKGLGILAKGPVIPLVHPVCERSAFFFPVYLPHLDLRLLAVWAFNHRVEKFDPPRTGMVLDVLDDLKDWLAPGRSIVAGDFNNNANWDKPGRPNRFVDIATRLNALGFVSAYHEESGEALGSETAMTHFWRKSVDTPYHIDYCFVHRALKVSSVQIPDFESWRKLSDHAPVVVEAN